MLRTYRRTYNRSVFFARSWFKDTFVIIGTRLQSKGSSASIFPDLLKSLGQISANLHQWKIWIKSLRFTISRLGCGLRGPLLQEHPYYEKSRWHLPAPTACSLVPSSCIVLYCFHPFSFHLLLLHWKSGTTVIKNNKTKEIKATTIKEKEIPVNNIYLGRFLLWGNRAV